MSSFTRRIERQVVNSRPHFENGAERHVSNGPKVLCFNGCGSKLGVKNDKDPCVTGKRKKAKAWRSKANAPAPKPKFVFKESPAPTRAEIARAHKTKMSMKAGRTYLMPALPATFLSASVNRHTERPHEHKREIARRLRQSA